MPPVPKAPPPKPRPGQHRRPTFSGGRLEGLGSPAPTSLRASTPTPGRASTPLAQPQARAKPLCPNPDCPDRSKVTRTDQGLICESCGALVQEDSGLVSEQGFGETESGRIVATGVQVSQDQTHQKNYSTGNAFGIAGREQTLSSERTKTQARNIMASYVPIFGLQTSDVDRGVAVFGLAVRHNFLTGRTIESVAVLSLYIACRRRKEQVQGVQRPVYGLMLIDFAERLNMDVFKLGKIYRKLYETIYYMKTEAMWRDATNSVDYQGMDPAVLVPKFVKELEFDKRDEPKIQYDAIQIIKRMKRDWIHHGRRPSGVCGAAVLLAARMNNYRRTTREVVLTAKVTEITLNKRLQEFHNTQVSTLSVTKFSEEAKVWEKLKEGEHWLDEDQPPINKERLNPKEKKKRGRPRKRPLPETAAEIEGDTATTEIQASSEAHPQPAKRVRIDAEGYKIPEIPARRTGGDASQGASDTSSTSQVEEESPESLQGEKRPATQGAGETPDAASEQLSPSSQREDNEENAKPGKRYRAPGWQPPAPLPAEIALESDIEAAFDDTLNDNRELSDKFGVQSTSKARTVASQSASSQAGADQQPLHPRQQDQQQESMGLEHDPTQTVPPHRKDKILGPPCNTSIGNLGHVSLSPTLKAAEFDSDEDVSTCNLTEEETRIKERVWVSMNADWLRKNHAKRIKKELIEAEMRARGLDPVEEEKKKKAARGKKKDGTKKPGRIGDVSYLRGQNKKRKAPVGEGTEGGVEGEDGNAEGEAAESADPGTAAKSVRSMLETRGTFSRRVNYAALEAIYGNSATSEESAESRSATDDGRSRSGSIAASEAGQQASRESSVAGPAIPAHRATSTAITPSAIFRGNQGRANRGTLAAERRERQRNILNAQKKAGGGGGRSASRSRSTSTPASEAGGQSTPEPQSGAQTQPSGQSSSQPHPLPTPPATQLGPQIPGIHTASSDSTSTPLALQSGPRIPGTETTAPPSTPPASRLGPQIPGIRSTTSKPSSPLTSPSALPGRRTTESGSSEGPSRLGQAARQTSKSQTSSDDDEDMEDAEEEEEEDDDDSNSENENEAADKKREEDLDAIFEGRYEGREAAEDEDADADSEED